MCTFKYIEHKDFIVIVISGIEFIDILKKTILPKQSSKVFFGKFLVFDGKRKPYSEIPVSVYVKSKHGFGNRVVMQVVQENFEW